MRAFIAIAILVFGAAGITGARAADLPAGGGARGQGYSLDYSVVGGPAAPLIIYDYEPGITIRAYWLPPWRNRHYFPFHGKLGKRHATASPAVRPKPAQTYWRYWSNDGAFINDQPPAMLPSFDRAPAPRGQIHSKPVTPH